MSRMPWLLSLALLLPGCAWERSEVGLPLPDPSSLEIGQSTVVDALELLGPPRIIRRQFDGELYTWRYTVSRLRSLDLVPEPISVFYYSTSQLRQDDLTMLFDRQGVLRGMGVRRETEPGDESADEP